MGCWVSKAEVPDQFAGETAFHRRGWRETTKTGELIWKSVEKEKAYCECEQEYNYLRLQRRVEILHKLQEREEEKGEEMHPFKV